MARQPQWSEMAVPVWAGFDVWRRYYGGLAGFVLALSFLFATTGISGATEGYVADRAVLVDPTGTLSIEDVVQRGFSQIGPFWAGGYTEAVTWIRVTVTPTTADAPLLMRIRPSYLDRVDLYEPDAALPGGWRVRTVGDLNPVASRDYPAVIDTLAITPSAPVTVYYVRLETTSSSLINIEVVTEATARHEAVAYMLRYGCYLAGMLAILLAGVREWISGRDRAVAWFVSYQASAIVYSAAITGILAFAMPIQTGISADFITSVLVILSCLTGVAFHRNLVFPYAPNRLALLFCDGLLVVLVLALVLLACGAARLALQLNALVMAASAPTSLVLAFTTRNLDKSVLRWLRVIYSLQALSMFVTFSPLIGLVPASAWSLYGALIHALFSSALILGFILMRARERRAAAKRGEIELGVARQELLLMERQRDLQSRFLAMLTHELKTPLSVARIASDSVEGNDRQREVINRALSNVNAIVDRCSYADQMEQQQITKHPEPVDVAALVQQVTELSGAPQRVVAHLKAFVPVTTDRLLLGVVLGNLIDNALKYSPVNSQVELYAARQTQAGRIGLSITVENEADRGVLPDPQRLFIKYYRSPGAHRQSGSGLGLYIVQGVVELLGGSIAYEPAGGRARFILWLPC